LVVVIVPFYFYVMYDHTYARLRRARDVRRAEQAAKA
jgi:hypothetical protein